jgi:hypothetical protein
MKTGDDPPRDRTAELRALGFPTRHLGSVQMTTDTALGVTKRVIVDRGSSFLLFSFLFPTTLPFSSARGDPIHRSSLSLSSGVLVLKIWACVGQDYPTIRFNARESVEMPFRASLRPTLIPTGHLT